jgi:hypothetical protein
MMRAMDDDIKQREIERLYRQAFAEYGTIALWSMRPVEHPTAGDALAITNALRVEGDLAARKLAFDIERLCGAA